MDALDKAEARVRLLSRLWVLGEIEHKDVTPDDRTVLEDLATQGKVIKDITWELAPVDVTAEVHAAIKMVLAKLTVQSHQPLTDLYSAVMPPLIDAAIQRLVTDDIVVVNDSAVARRWPIGLSVEEAQSVIAQNPVPSPAPVIPDVSVPEFTDKERDLLFRAARVPQGAAFDHSMTNKEAFKALTAAGWLTQVEQLRWVFTRPDDVQYTSEELTNIREVGASIVRQLSDPAGTGADSLTDLRTQYGDDTVDAAALRLEGFVLRRNAGRWSIIGHRPRPTTADRAEKQRRAKVKAEEERQEQVTEAEPQPEPDALSGLRNEVIGGLNAVYSEVQSVRAALGEAVKARLITNRATPESTMNRVAALLLVHGPMTVGDLKNYKLSSQQSALLDTALERGLELEVFSPVPRMFGQRSDRFELKNPPPNVTWDQLHEEARRINARAKARELVAG